MTTLNVPKQHKIPLKDTYKPDPKAGKLPHITRGTGDKAVDFNKAILAIGENAKEGMKLIANVMMFKDSDIQPTVVFNFYRATNTTVYLKDVLATSLEEEMGGIVRSAYT